MFKSPLPEQTALEMVTLDSLVPKDHLLLRIDALSDFFFFMTWPTRSILPKMAALRSTRL
jgi:hypothetical protein